MPQTNTTIEESKDELTLTKFSDIHTIDVVHEID